MDLVAGYDRLLNADPNPDVPAKAAKDWCDWEDAWLEDDELLRNAGPVGWHRGRADPRQIRLQGPPDVAWQLAQVWPDAELHLVNTGGTPAGTR